jgi:hypothetical protein
MLIYFRVWWPLVCCRSDQWDVQATIKRVNELLIARGYGTWFDLTNMKGNHNSVLCTAAAAASSLTDLAAVSNAWA